MRYFLFRRNYVIYLFNVVKFFKDVRLTFYFGTFELRVEITLQLRFVFNRHCDIFFITSQLHYLFLRCSYIFYDVRITLYFGTFELRMEVTLKLRFVFVFHCEVFFITSQLRYVFVRCSNVFYDVRITLYFETYESNVTITFRFCSSF